jgi:hypothetical protein
MNCYNNIILSYNKGLFDKWLDMIYVLTMENSTRTSQFMNQLNGNLFHTITIQVNKGYKLCKKNLYKQSSIQDLNECYLRVFRNAKANNYKNIMILEDDFILDINQSIVDSIGQFINNNYYHIYNLGPVAHISIPFNDHHKSLISTTAHGVIYSSHYIDYYIDNYMEARKHNPDLYWNKIEIIKYKYYKPLCFQTFPVTSSQKDWELPKWFLQFAIFSIKILKLDVSYQPGFSILNIIGYIPFILFIKFIFSFNIK